jgi:hypothetical protein
MPYSRITIGSLADYGYSANLFAADPYTVPAPGISAALQGAPGASVLPAAWEVMLRPRFSIGTNRVITKFPQ